jgi:hypothetical protein
VNTPSLTPRVFISHGPVRQDPPNQLSELLSTIAETVSRLGFDVYLDRDFGPHIAGMPFDAPLWKELDECAAAIVVWTPSAVSESWWVLAEIGRLKNRCDHEPGFLLLPVFADGARPEHLKSDRWDPYELDRIQGLSTDSPSNFQGADSSSLLDSIAKRLSPVWEAWQAQQKYGDVFKTLVERFQKLNETTLKESLAALNSVTGQGKWSMARNLASAFLRAKDLQTVKAAIQAIIREERGMAVEIASIVLPFTWLDEDHAQLLRDIVVGPIDRHGAATLSTSKHACAMLVRRACQEEPGWKALSVGSLVDGDMGQMLLRKTRQALWDLYKDDSMTDEDLSYQLQLSPCILGLPRGVYDVEMLQPLRETFPELTIFFPGMSAQDIEAGGLDFVSYIQLPETPPDLERQVMAVYRHFSSLTPHRS